MEIDKALEDALNQYLERGNFEQFFLCVVLIGEAQCGGKAQLAKATGLSRQTIYSSMKHGNPRYKTFNALLNVIGLCFQVKANYGTETSKPVTGIPSI